MAIQIIILLPFLLSLSIGIFGRFLGRYGALEFSIILLSFLILLNFVVFFEVLQGVTYEIVIYKWFDLYFGCDFTVLIDSLSVLMSLLILIISSCIILYSFEYMEADAHLLRFISYLFLFVFFMIFLVFSNNLVQTFIGWEGVGLTSFLLINFWFTRLEANRSAFKAVLFNKISDAGFIVCLVVILCVFKTTNLGILNNFVDYFKFLTENETDYIEIFFIFLFIAAIGKSAQLGLHAWLPDAMEGPTPVSSLLHSATMVTVGIYVMLRLSFLLVVCKNVVFIIAFFGCLTALLGSTVALFQEDMKKIIAYSTCSQLGLLVAALGVCNFNGCFFHLISHAFFKALLFLTAGCIIHALSNEQDVRRAGGLLFYMPLTVICMFIGILGLVGFPFLSGFYSKEFLLLFFYVNTNFFYNYIYIVLYLSSIFTILYGLKLFFFIFLTNYRGNKVLLKYAYDSNLLMSFAILVLSTLTIFFGYFFEDIFIGLGNSLWYGVLPTSITFYDNFIFIESLAAMTKLSLVFIFILFFFLFYLYWTHIIGGFSFFLRMAHLNQYIFKLIYSFFVNSWWFSYFYKYVVDIFYNFTYNVIFCIIDRGLFEKMLVLNSYHNLFIFSQFFYSNNSDVSNSFFSLLIFIFGVFLFVFLSIFVLNVYLKYIFLINFLLLLDFFSTFYLKRESRALYFD